MRLCRENALFLDSHVRGRKQPTLRPLCLTLLPVCISLVTESPLSLSADDVGKLGAESLQAIDDAHELLTIDAQLEVGLAWLGPQRRSRHTRRVRASTRVGYNTVPCLLNL